MMRLPPYADPRDPPELYAFAGRFISALAMGDVQHDECLEWLISGAQRLVGWDVTELEGRLSRFLTEGVERHRAAQNAPEKDQPGSLGIRPSENEAMFLAYGLRHDAERLATLYWWGTYTIEDGLAELRATAIARAERAGYSCDPKRIATREMDEAIERHAQKHGESMKAMVDATKAALEQGRTAAQIAYICADVARSRAFPPPPYLMAHAMEAGAKEFRMSRGWWRKRGA